MATRRTLSRLARRRSLDKAQEPGNFYVSFIETDLVCSDGSAPFFAVNQTVPQCSSGALPVSMEFQFVRVDDNSTVFTQTFPINYWDNVNGDLPSGVGHLRLRSHDRGPLHLRADGDAAGAVAPSRVARARGLRDERVGVDVCARVLPADVLQPSDITLTPALAGNPQTGKLPGTTPRT